MMQNTPMVLAACFNEPYVPHVATMLRSFADSTSGPARWYLISDGSVSVDVMQDLLEHVRAYGISAEPFRIPEHLLAGFDDGLSAKYPGIAWYRSVLAEALPHEDRLIYLDSDLLVLHDMQPLWDTELADGHLFGAVSHPSYGGAGNECIRLGLPPDSPLLNSGVMVMDLALMRSERFAARIGEFIRDPARPPLRYADQDAMNVLFAGRWTALDPSWNCISIMLLPYLSAASWEDDIHHGPLVLERAARSPAVVHFDGAKVLRPWHRRCFNPFAGLYRSYRATTPWPLVELQGGRHDAVLAHLPPRLQAKVWHVRRPWSGAP